MKRERELPSSPESERALLGMVLMDPKVLPSAQELVDAGDFSTETHRQIFRTLDDMQNREVPIDIVTVIDELRARELTVPPEYVASLIDGIPDRPNPERYAITVRDLARARRLYHAVTAASSSVLNREPVDDVISNLEENINTIAQAGRSDLRSMPQVVDEFLDKFHLLSASDRPSTGLTTSLPELDAMTTGLRTGLHIFAGRTSQGKSALLEQIALANARQGHRVHIATLEMTSEVFVERGVSIITGIPQGDVRDPRYLNHEQRKRVDEAAEMLKQWPWTVDDTAGLELHQLIARLRGHINRGCELVLVDYLQMIQCREYSSAYDKISAISAGLRDLAKTARVPVVAACQLRRPQPGYENTRPSIYELKESGSIENDATAVFLIYRPIDKETGAYTGRDEIIVAKQRHGRLGKVDVVFVGQRAKFEPRAREDSQREQKFAIAAL